MPMIGSSPVSVPSGKWIGSGTPAVMVLPLRTRRTHRLGAEPLLLYVVETFPPVAVRRCQRQTPEPFTVSAVMREFAASVSRIMIPTRALMPVSCNALTRDFSAEIQLAKDCGSLAVLIAILLALGVWAAALADRLYGLAG